MIGRVFFEALAAFIGSMLIEPDRQVAWFIALLVLGLLSIGFLATLIYVVAGPPDAPESASPTVVGVENRRSTPVAH